MVLISGCLRLQNELEEALEWGLRCFNAETRVFGPDLPETFRTRFEVGLVYLALGDCVRAEEHFQATCQASQRILGDIYRLQGKYSKAEDTFLGCLREDSAYDRIKQYCWRKLALLYLGTQEYDRAKACVTRAFTLLGSQGWTTEKLESYTALFTLKVQNGEFNSLDEIDAFDKVLEDANWTQDVWKSSACHHCHREICGKLYACSACPPLSLYYCRACVDLKKHDAFCKHSINLLKGHQPPMRYLQEERLKTLAERSDWSDYACRHRAYKAYCVENNVPLHERLPKESFMADRADVKATNCCPFSFQRLLSLVFRK
ncbi:hypothetical protein AeRB84_015361 [Aphanomyces euteiches]|nr:hypothetical protein AeRB84_015361 [Aphanomyces euteiches]